MLRYCVPCNSVTLSTYQSAPADGLAWPHTILSAPSPRPNRILRIKDTPETSNDASLNDIALHHQLSCSKNNACKETDTTSLVKLVSPSCVVPTYPTSRVRQCVERFRMADRRHTPCGTNYWSRSRTGVGSTVEPQQWRPGP